MNWNLEVHEFYEFDHKIALEDDSEKVCQIAKDNVTRSLISAIERVRFGREESSKERRHRIGLNKGRAIGFIAEMLLDFCMYTNNFLNVMLLIGILLQ